MLKLRAVLGFCLLASAVWLLWVFGRTAGPDGMAALATAERFALRGNIKDAMVHARRAAKALPEGSPGWLRAQDILSLKVE